MYDENNELVTLNYDRLIDERETRLAWCVVFGGRAYPLPKSQVEDIRETAHEIDMPWWLVKTKGLESYVVE